MLTPLRTETLRSATIDAIEATIATRETHRDVFEALERGFGEVRFDGFDAHPRGMFQDGEDRIEVIGCAYFEVGTRAARTSEELDTRFRARVAAGRVTIESVVIHMPE